MEIGCGKWGTDYEKTVLDRAAIGGLYFFLRFVGVVEKADRQVLLEKLNRDTKIVAVVDGSGNQDKEAIANKSRVVGHALFSKTGHGEKVKPGKEMTCPGCRRIWLPKSPHAPQARRQPMFISRTACAKPIPDQESRGLRPPPRCTTIIFSAQCPTLWRCRRFSVCRSPGGESSTREFFYNRC